MMQQQQQHACTILAKMLLLMWPFIFRELGDNKGQHVLKLLLLLLLLEGV